MPAVDDFRNHPRTFMRANVVMVLGETGGAGGIKSFSFNKSTGLFAQDMLHGGNAMDVYVLRLGDNTGDQVSAYWCPYSANDYLGTTLPGTGGPDLMFTYAMDGCTFAAGSRTLGKDVVVHHVNMSNAAGALKGGTDTEKAEQQRRLQRNVAKSMVTNAVLVDPDEYYEPSRAPIAIPPGAKISTVTFGRRSAREGWKFYTHQWYTVAGDRMNLKFFGTQRVI